MRIINGRFTTFKIVFYLGIFLMSSCSSNVKITTNPTKAAIYLKNLQTGQSQKIGETPLILSSSDIKDYVDIGVPVVIQLKKEGHITKETVITDLMARNIELSYELEPENFLNMAHSMDNIINKLFACQKLMRKNNIVEAQKILDDLKIQHPYLSVIYEFQGGIHLVNKDYTKALDSYKEAIKFNAQNLEALRLKRAIEDRFKLGGSNVQRKPAQQKTISSAKNNATTGPAPAAQ